MSSIVLALGAPAASLYCAIKAQDDMRQGRTVMGLWGAACALASALLIAMLLFVDVAAGT